ncbi:hypothetical protein [Clostridium tyrobutyricum]|uniref:hypothetical protein n=1 Tax=Clostridium tyrobutyricum TaxID=1519 RepID=UPI002B220A31|nr:hypothetical protein [Clostridium tyrobutyricum]MEA5009059.1 hypothetical protein [Clostridium tyrobutyricum]
MFDIETTDELNMKQYIKRHGIKGEYRYLFTFDKNYIFIMKENKSINTYRLFKNPGLFKVPGKLLTLNYALAF